MIFEREDFPVLLEKSIGCSVPDQWGFYVSIMLDRFVYLQETRPEYKDLRVIQIKEKFGGLRVYCDGADEYINGHISMTAILCHTTCVTCGSHEDVVNSYETPDGYWLSPRCKLHRQETNDENN